MAQRPVQRFWRTSRRIFRWTRLALWLLVLTLLGALLYLNRVGVPDFLKRRLLQELRARGVELRVSRLRWAWYRGIVAENALFGGTNRASGPELFAETVELRPDFNALKHFKLDVRGLGLHRGRFTWRLNTVGHPPRTLAVDQISAEIHFLPDDRWQLDRIQATYAGAKVRLTGTITNASALAEWKTPGAERAAPPGQWEDRLSRLAEIFDEIHFFTPPELNVLLTGDARDPQSFQGLLTLRAAAADSPWANASGVTLTARLIPAPAPRSLPLATLTLKAGSVKTRWAATRDADLTLSFVGAENATNSFRARLDLTAGASSTEWCTASQTRGTVRWTQSLTNPVPTQAEADIQLTRVRTPWGRAETAHLLAHLWPADTNQPAGLGAGWPWFGRPGPLTNPLPVQADADLRLTGLRTEWGQAQTARLLTRWAAADPQRPAPADASWGGWAPLARYQFSGHLDLADLEAQRVAANQVVADAQWRPPELAITNLQARLYGGQLDAQLGLDVATRAAHFHLTTDVDAHRLDAALPEAARRWVDQFQWEQPPRLSGQGDAVLPAWTNRAPDWREEVLPTLRLEAEVECGPGSYRGVEVSSARTRVTYADLCLGLPDLRLTRPEGQARLAHRANGRTREIYWRVDAGLDPNALRPVLGEGARRILNDFQFSQPPRIEAEIWAASGEESVRGVTGRVALTNFAFRGEAAASFQTALRWTNQVLELLQPALVRTDGVARVDLVRVDLAADRIYLTNGFGTTDPMAIARAIGTNTVRAIENYHFFRPPTARVNGAAPLHGTEGFDLHFQVDGGPFQWWRFHLPHVSGAVNYVGEDVTLDGITADFYSGQLAGSAAIHLTHEPGEDLRFAATFSDANLHFLMHDLAGRTNHLEGLVNGHLTVTSANTADWESWQGYGDVTLRDGLVWELPLFGIFTPIFNGLVPGLGNSRFSRGDTTFTITNSVVRFDDLELNAPLLRMKCRGTVDFHERVNAAVEAEPLRNAWLIGPLLNTVLRPVTKALEYKVTGTLGQPKAEPLYVPKILLFPLQPFQTLKDIFTDQSGKTNAPPK